MSYTRPPSFYEHEDPEHQGCDDHIQPEKAAHSIGQQLVDKEAGIVPS
jgi:hypothetical protein